GRVVVARQRVRAVGTQAAAEALVGQVDLALTGVDQAPDTVQFGAVAVDGGGIVQVTLAAGQVALLQVAACQGQVVFKGTLLGNLDIEAASGFGHTAAQGQDGGQKAGPGTKQCFHCTVTGTASATASRCAR